MHFATVVGTVALMLSPHHSGVPLLGIVPQASQQERPKADSSSSGQQNPNQPQPAPAAQPCSTTPPQGSASSANCQPSATKKTKTKKHSKTEKPAPAPDGGPTETVVRNGSTAEPTVEISPSMSQQQASRQLEATKELLDTTDANLKMIATQTLSASQQDTVQQIQNYQKQAEDARKAGDSQRAYNLANKAKMLSADLVGH